MDGDTVSANRFWRRCAWGTGTSGVLELRRPGLLDHAMGHTAIRRGCQRAGLCDLRRTHEDLVRLDAAL